MSTDETPAVIKQAMWLDALNLLGVSRDLAWHVSREEGVQIVTDGMARLLVDVDFVLGELSKQRDNLRRAASDASDGVTSTDDDLAVAAIVSACGVVRGCADWLDSVDPWEAIRKSQAPGD